MEGNFLAAGDAFLRGLLVFLSVLGGSDNDHTELREAYGHIPKPQARKIKAYLYTILEDAWRYQRDRKPGRRRKVSK